MQTNIIRNFKSKYCDRCKRFGNHTKVLCNEFIEQHCCFCGQFHSFASEKCSSRICTKCYQHHHPDDKCRVYMLHLNCTICNLNGHSDDLCTNNWRLFHSVTNLNDLSQYKAPIIRHCGICLTCGSKMHSSYKCPSLKNTIHFCNPTPKSKIVNRLKVKLINESSDKRNSEAPIIKIDDESPNHLEYNDESQSECNQAHLNNKSWTKKKYFSKKFQPYFRNNK